MSSSRQVWSPTDQADLQQAHARLESSSFAQRLAHAIGSPIGTGLKLLPKSWHRGMQRSAEKAVWKALQIAVCGLRDQTGLPAGDLGYRLAAIATGTVGGFFGAPALLLESPLTTVVMLRSVASIARAEGESLDELETRLACLEVFALGGRSPRDDTADLGYLGLRLALEAPLAGASRHVAQHGLAGASGSPQVVQLISTISRRLGVVLTERAAAKLIPFIGAAGGALVNGLFMRHFQDIARGHFTVRRLERKLGTGEVHAYYRQLREPRVRVLAYPLSA